MSRLAQRCWRKISRSHRKYAVGLLGVLTQAVTLGLLDGAWLHAAQLGIALLTAEGVRVTTNLPEPGEAD